MNNKLFSKKALLLLIFPILIEQLLTVLVGIVDVAMVSSVGEAAVSGVSLVDSINNLLNQVLFALAAGGTVVCAQYIGAKNRQKASKTYSQLLLLILIFTICTCCVFIIGGTPLLRLIFGQVEEAVMKNASIYLFLTAFSFPFLGIYQAGSAAFRAIGNTKISMYVSLFMNGINIAGNAVCIFGLKMGVEGVAIPTLIARTIGALTIMYLVQKKGDFVRLTSFADLKPCSSYIKKILSIGIPNSVESGMFQLGKLMLQSLVATLGTPSIAAYAVASNLATFYYLPGNALGAATLTIVGQCEGAGEREQSRYYMKLMVILNYLILAVICTILVLGRKWIIGSYHLSAEASTLGCGLIMIHGIAMVIWPIAFLLPYYFRASGRARFTMLVAVFTMWVFRIGLAIIYIKVLHMNVLGIWYAMFVDWIFRVIIYLITFRKDGIKNAHARQKGA